MGTYYDTLGVKPGATSDQIRKAYLRRARALHPDRQLGRPDAEARRAEQAMQQVNMAWSVLSDPAKKAEYDKRTGLQKGGSSSSAAPRAASGKPASTPPPRQPRQTTSSRTAAASSSPRAADPAVDGEGMSVWASVPVLVLIGLLLGIVIVTAFANGEPTDNRPVVPATTTGLGVGDCFAFEGTEPRVRSCNTGVADGQIVDALPDAANCPENSQFMPDPESDFTLCWVRMIPGSTNTVPSG